MQAITDNIYVLVTVSMLGTIIMVSVFIWLLMRNQKRLYQQRERYQRAEIRHQQNMLRSIIESQEAERTRIGRDLHDEVGTALSTLRITMERFAMETSDNAAVTKLVITSKTIIDKVIADVRNISHTLSPELFTINSLPEALENLCDVINAAGRQHVEIINEANEIPDTLPLTTALVVYRVLQELLNNTIRHARAKSIHIHFTATSQRLTIHYSDDGIGMGPTIKKGSGLQNIESRLSIVQGSFQMITTGGFQMLITIPI